MTKLKWWLRVVAVLYLVEGGGLTLMALFDPGQFGALWASVPVGTLDEAAVRGIRVAGLPGVLTWVLLSVLMMIFSRFPQRAGLLVLVVALWELLVWVPADLVGLSSGFAVPRAAALVAVHVAIGVSGLWLLRHSTQSRAPRGHDPASTGTA